MKARHGLTALLTVATALTAGILTAPSAHAGTLSCGDTITADVTLTRDLTCAGTALHVRVPEGVTVHVDLGGHTISGNGSGIGIQVDRALFPPGSLAVSHGTVRGFGIALIGQPLSSWGLVANASLDRVELRDNGRWLPSTVRWRLEVTRSRIIDSGDGGAWTDGATLTVRQSYVLRSRIVSASESFNYLRDSVFVDGTFVHGAAANVVATGNLFRRCDLAISAPDVWASSPTTIEHNVFDSCRIGVSLSTGGGTVSVSRNAFLHNSGDGFTFSARGRTALTVEGNRFLGNGGNGMSGIGNPSVVVRGNVAIGNGGHGIDVTGVVDGGGNVALGNRTSLQCTGVTCTP